MNIKDEIVEAMSDFTACGNEISAEFLFNENFAGFQGHFPGNPILPGVCQIEMILATLEKALDEKLLLKKVVRGKYVTPVKPNEKVKVSGTFARSAEGAISAKFALTKEGSDNGDSQGANSTVSRLSIVAGIV